MYCAMIGDLIRSKNIDENQREAVQIRLKQALDEINFEFRQYLVSPFLVTLGDEFQGLLTAAEPTLEIIGLVDRSLEEYGVHVRYGIGLGEISTTINREQALGDDGPAYHLAREGIEALKKENWTGFPVSIRTGRPDTPLLQSICRLLNEMAESWSNAQRQSILDMELMNEQMLVARKNQVDQSSVSRALKRGHYKVWQQTKETLTQYLLSEYDSPESAGRQGRYNRAISQSRRRNYEDAAAILEELLAEFPEVRGNPIPAREDVALSLSEIYSKLFRYDPAIQLLEETLPFTENRSAKIKLLGQLGYCYSEKAKSIPQETQAREFSLQAIQILKEALALCETEDAQKAELQTNLAFAYTRAGKTQEAIQLREELQQWLRDHRIQNQESEIVNLHNLGCIYWNHGQLDQAGELLREAVTLSRQTAVPFYGIGSIYSTYALLLCQTNAPVKEVLTTAETALQYARRDRDFREIKETCMILEPLYQKTGNEEGLRTCLELRLQAEKHLRKET